MTRHALSVAMEHLASRKISFMVQYNEYNYRDNEEGYQIFIPGALDAIPELLDYMKSKRFKVEIHRDAYVR